MAVFCFQIYLPAEVLRSGTLSHTDRSRCTWARRSPAPSRATQWPGWDRLRNKARTGRRAAWSLRSLTRKENLAFLLPFGRAHAEFLVFKTDTPPSCPRAPPASRRPCLPLGPAGGAPRPVLRWLPPASWPDRQPSAFGISPVRRPPLR